jgi:hypothetical protein
LEFININVVKSQSDEGVLRVLLDIARELSNKKYVK